ncbi:MAG TPA: DEAD/DEAH box helicase [Methanospirillum sp.]|nr:DEAD/DEAH box helicase [Methanospirillum sp.]
MSDKTRFKFQNNRSDTESHSSLPILHALVNPAIQAVALFAEYGADISAQSTTKKGTEKGKPGIYPYALDHTSLKELVRNCFDIGVDEFKATRWIIYIPASDTVPSSLVFRSKEKTTPKTKTLPLVPLYVPVILCPYDSFFDLWKAGTKEPEGYIAGDSFRYTVVLMESALTLVQTGKFKPQVDKTFTGYHVTWIPALSPEDTAWLSDFSSRMPPVCQYSIPRLAKEPFFPKPESRVHTALLEMMQVIIHRAFSDYSFEAEPDPLGFEPDQNSINFMTELTGTGLVVNDTAFEKVFAQGMQNWLTYSSSGTFSEFKFCIIVKEPPEGETEPWDISLHIKSVADPSLIIPAETIWNLPDNHGGFLPPAAYLRYQLLAGIGNAAASSSVLREHLTGKTPTGGRLTLLQAADFLGSDLQRIQRRGVIVLLPAWWTDQSYKPRIELHAQKRDYVHRSSMLGIDEILSFDYRIAIGDDSYSPDEFWEAVKLKAPFVRIGGRWIPCNQDAITRALNHFQNRSGRSTDTACDLLRLSLGEMNDPEVSISIHAKDEWVADILTFLKTDTNQVSCIVPDTFHGTLRPYQEEGFSFLYQCTRRGFGACLADDMGLGKTPQTLAWLLYLKEREPGLTPALLICPMSVVGNWEREINRFAPSLKAWVHHGTDRCKGEELIKMVNSYDLVLTTYHLAARDVDHLKKVSWSALILDEAQNIKNPSTNQSKAIKTFPGERRVALTGTPVENRLLELWSIMDFLNPGYLGSQHAFSSRYTRTIEQDKDQAFMRELRSLIRPFILRRMKTDKNVIADLPEKMEARIYCSLTPEQATLYQAVVNEMAQNIDAVEGIARKGIILASITRLKQICNHPGVIAKDSEMNPSRSGKIQRLLEMLEEVVAEGDSALIFSQYATFAEELAEMMKEKVEAPVLLLTGSVPRKKREQLIEQFQAADTPSIFVISLKAGGTGLNLTRATHVFHVDRWWNPAVEDQATDRTYRIGQNRNVQVHLMIAAGTLEERIDLMNQEKRSLAQEVLAHGDEHLTNLSTKDLLEIVSLRDSVFASEEEA